MPLYKAPGITEIENAVKSSCEFEAYSCSSSNILSNQTAINLHICAHEVQCFNIKLSNFQRASQMIISTLQSSLSQADAPTEKINTLLYIPPGPSATPGRSVAGTPLVRGAKALPGATPARTPARDALGLNTLQVSLSDSWCSFSICTSL